jgi:hypothetical protein
LRCGTAARKFNNPRNDVRINPDAPSSRARRLSLRAAVSLATTLLELAPALLLAELLLVLVVVVVDAELAVGAARDIDVLLRSNRVAESKLPMRNLHF